eukprot:7384636-Prymnesium_polylepis.1
MDGPVLELLRRFHLFLLRLLGQHAFGLRGVELRGWRLQLRQVERRGRQALCTTVADARSELWVGHVRHAVLHLQ